MLKYVFHASEVLNMVQNCAIRLFNITYITWNEQNYSVQVISIDQYRIYIDK